MFSVFTPATTANLGSGFDILGISLNLFNEFIVEEADSYQLENFAQKYRDYRNNLIIKSYQQTCAFLKVKAEPFKLTIKQNIPNSKGLGSSASCIVAGILIAEELSHQKISDLDKLKIATHLEGHPDNVAPCLFGGLIGSALKKDFIFKSAYPFNPNLNIYVCIPDFCLSTNKARQVLPEQVKLSSAIANNSNCLILLKGLETANEELLKIGIDDFFHTKYRIPLISEYHKVLRILNSNSTISGAGPTILSITSQTLDLDEITKKLAQLNNHWEIKALKIDQKGAYIVHE